MKSDADMKVIMGVLKADENMRIRLQADESWHVYSYSRPDSATVLMTRKTMTKAELADFIRSGEYAKGEP